MTGRISSRHRLASRASQPTRGRFRRSAAEFIASCRYLYQPNTGIPYFLYYPSENIECSSGLADQEFTVTFHEDAGEWSAFTWFDPQYLGPKSSAPANNVYNVNDLYYGPPCLNGRGFVDDFLTIPPRVDDLSIRLSDFRTALNWFPQGMFPSCTLYDEYIKYGSGEDSLGSDTVPGEQNLTAVKVPCQIDPTNSMILDSVYVGNLGNPLYDADGGLHIYYNSTVGPNSVDLRSVPLSELNPVKPYVESNSAFPLFHDGTQAKIPPGSPSVVGAHNYTSMTVGHSDTSRVVVDFRDGVLVALPNFASTSQTTGVGGFRATGVTYGDPSPTETMPKFTSQGAIQFTIFPGWGEYHTTFNVVMTENDYLGNPIYYDDRYLNKPSPVLTGIDGNYPPGQIPLLLCDVPMGFLFEALPPGLTGPPIVNITGGSSVFPNPSLPFGMAGYVHDGVALTTPWRDGAFSANLPLPAGLVGGYQGGHSGGGAPTSASLTPSSLSFWRADA